MTDASACPPPPPPPASSAGWPHPSRSSPPGCAAPHPAGLMVNTLKHVSGACFQCRHAHIIRRVCIELAVLRVALQFLHVVSAPLVAIQSRVSMSKTSWTCCSAAAYPRVQSCAHSPKKACTRVEQTLQRQAAAGTTSTCRQPACCCQSQEIPDAALRSRKASAHLGPDALLHLQQVLLVQLLGPVRQRRQVPAGEPKALSARLQFAMRAA